jgi:hypothetical protein
MGVDMMTLRQIVFATREVKNTAQGGCGDALAEGLEQNEKIVNSKKPRNIRTLQNN